MAKTTINNDYSALITTYYKKVSSEVIVDKISKDILKQFKTISRQIAGKIMENYTISNVIIKELPINKKDKQITVGIQVINLKGIK